MIAAARSLPLGVFLVLVLGMVWTIIPAEPDRGTLLRIKLRKAYRGIGFTRKPGNAAGLFYGTTILRPGKLVPAVHIPTLLGYALMLDDAEFEVFGDALCHLVAICNDLTENDPDLWDDTILNVARAVMQDEYPTECAILDRLWHDNCN